MKIGNMVMAINNFFGHPHGCRGYSTFPCEYGFHMSVFIVPGTIGILVEKRKDFHRVLFESHCVWIEEQHLSSIE